MLDTYVHIFFYSKNICILIKDNANFVFLEVQTMGQQTMGQQLMGPQLGPQLSETELW